MKNRRARPAIGSALAHPRRIAANIAKLPEMLKRSHPEPQPLAPMRPRHSGAA